MTTTQLSSVIDLHGGDVPLARTCSENVLDTGGIKVTRIEVPQGGEIPRHSSPCAATLQCVTGSVVVGLDDDELRLSAGQLVFFDAHQPHAVMANSDSILLLTQCVQETEKAVTAEEANSAGLDAMDQTAKESFPASDPPAWTPITGT